MYDIEKIKSLLEIRLTDKRYYHSLCVADMAKQLAEIYGESADKAYFTGLVHDIMRCESKEDMLMYIEKNNIHLDDYTKESVVLWHANLGADYLYREFGITDADILNAVRYHTTARVNPSLLEKIIFLADCSSADRNYWNVEEIRSIIRTDINKAMFEVLDFTVNDLKSKGLTIHPDTLGAYKEFSTFNC